MTLAERIVKEAREAIGIPFRHQGRSDSGLDCAGLVVRCAERSGLDYFDQDDYPRRPGGSRIEAALDAQPCLERIQLTEAAAGDVLLIRFMGDPQHLAIHAGETMIHAWEQIGKVCEHSLDAWRSGKIVRAYRFTEFK